MPFIDLPFGLKPILHFASGLAFAVVPEFVCPAGNLLFQANIYIHVEGGFGMVW